MNESNDFASFTSESPLEHKFDSNNNFVLQASDISTTATPTLLDLSYSTNNIKLSNNFLELPPMHFSKAINHNINPQNFADIGDIKISIKEKVICPGDQINGEAVITLHSKPKDAFLLTLKLEGKETLKFSHNDQILSQKIFIEEKIEHPIYINGNEIERLDFPGYTTYQDFDNNNNDLSDKEFYDKGVKFTYTMPFSFKIKKKCPASVSGIRFDSDFYCRQMIGQIQYKIIVSVETQKTFSHEQQICEDKFSQQSLEKKLENYINLKVYQKEFAA